MTTECNPGAAEVLGLRIDLDPPRSRATIVVLAILAFVFKVYDWSNLVRRQRFVVVIFNKKTNERVVEYAHRSRRDAEFQARRLSARLQTLDLESMFAHLGVSRVRVLDPQSRDDS